MSPLADTEFAWENTSSRNRKGKSEFILATGLHQAKKNIDALGSYDAAELFGALSFEFLVFDHFTTVCKFASQCS